MSNSRSISLNTSRSLRDVLLNITKQFSINTGRSLQDYWTIVDQYGTYSWISLNTSRSIRDVLLNTTEQLLSINTGRPLWITLFDQYSTSFYWIGLDHYGTSSWISLNSSRSIWDVLLTITEQFSINTERPLEYHSTILDQYGTSLKYHWTILE